MEIFAYGIVILVAAYCVIRIVKQAPRVNLRSAPRRWWPIPAFISTALLANLMLDLIFQPNGGHASGHLGSAAMVFPIMGLTAVILWAVPARQRRAELWAASAMLVAALSMIFVGNVGVINAIGGHNWSDAQAEAGRARAGVTADHELTEYGMLALFGAATLLTILLLVRKRVTTSVGIAALIANLFPPWIIPGAGIVVLAVGLTHARDRRGLSMQEAVAVQK